MTDAPDLGALVARLEQLEGERERDRNAKAALEEWHLDAAPKQTSTNAIRARASMLAVAARRKAEAEWQAACEAQAAKTQPARATVERDLAEIRDRVEAEHARHVQALAKLQAAVPKLNARMASLNKLPERPTPDYSAANLLFLETVADGTGQPPPTPEQYVAQLRRAAFPPS